MSNDKYFEVKINTKEIVNKLNEIKKDFSNLTPFLQIIDIQLRNAIDDNFATEGTSSGEKWKEWSDTYKKWKIKNHKGNDLILNSSADLRQSIISEIEGNKLTIGTPMEYAAIHNFGLKKTLQKNNKKGTSFSCDMNMPKREYMRFSPQTFEELLEELNDYAQKKLNEITKK